MERELQNLIDILYSEQCSCVIGGDRGPVVCRQRGVRDLLDILHADSSLLSGAVVADKVVGKGAAALMVLGGVHLVYAGVISRKALDLLNAESVPVRYGECVPDIVNRSGTGVCPVEELCADCHTAIECLPLIEQFVNSMNRL
ncbi:MAG: DUF1893 domain-containing protein [Muribaculaceae bacterium]|nr:DUF1893 domain-containing protein [Muribaculaceae bacterium]MDE5930080.1 DUF1893 domain-containing protein [Muribaculaceae bacterium]MDE6131401.1 DUF1893 domain-containing protein [Muribaculaceae bacterium]